jgi:hypothetical protein
LVSDLREKLVMLADLETGSATRVGREGQGPGEFGLPASLLPMPRGETLLQDLGNRRFLIVRPDGTVGATVPTPQPPSSLPSRPAGAMGLAGALIDPRGADAQGRLYFQGMVFPLEGETIDSVPILRWDRVRQAIDTVAWLPATEDMQVRVSRPGGGTMMVRMDASRAWPAQVQWGVTPDGRIAVVSPEPYRVSWITPRGRTAGPVVAYTPLDVTEADKRAYREALRRATPVVVAFGSGGARAAAPRLDMPEPEFPETMPPFSGREAVWVTSRGDVWVQRLRQASDQTPCYDVFDGAGVLVGQVALRPRSRVVGFGEGTVYVARADEDDLQYLERYRLP